MNKKIMKREQRRKLRLACPNCGSERPPQCINKKGCDNCITKNARDNSKKHSLTWDDIRDKRDKLLKETDYVNYSERISEKNKDVWLKYREKLFDITDKYDKPSEVRFPKKPKN